MKTVISLILILVLVSLTTACQNEKSDDTTTCEQVTLPQEVEVAANKRWVNVNIQLQAGQSVQITASGEADLEDGTYQTTPDGSESCEDSVWGSCTLEGAGWGTLLGRIGDGSPFVVGTSAQITADETGCLSFSINDVYFDDNSGGYSVTIEE